VFRSRKSNKDRQCKCQKQTQINGWNWLKTVNNYVNIYNKYEHCQLRMASKL
jgi:hypothetical protein